jgi:hypothetical protein
MIESPKKRFLAISEMAKLHRNLVNAPGFLMAMDFAMLQLVSTPGVTGEHLEGAKDFARILLTLADETPPRQPLPDINLKQT